MGGRSAVTLKNLMTVWRTNTNEEVSTPYCGHRRSRRDRASTCSRSRGSSLHHGSALRPPAPIYNWTGFYIGGHIGGAFNGDNNFNGLTTGNDNNGRFLGGLQVGADYQFAPNWVVGIEGQYSWLGSNSNGVIFPAPPRFVYTTTSARSAR